MRTHRGEYNVVASAYLSVKQEVPDRNRLFTPMSFQWKVARAAKASSLLKSESERARGFESPHLPPSLWLTRIVVITPACLVGYRGPIPL